MEEVMNTCSCAWREFLLKATIAFGNDHEDSKNDESNPLEGCEA